MSIVPPGKPLNATPTAICLERRDTLMLWPTAGPTHRPPETPPRQTMTGPMLADAAASRCTAASDEAAPGAENSAAAGVPDVLLTSFELVGRSARTQIS